MLPFLRMNGSPDFLEKAKAKEPDALLTEWVAKLGLEGGTALDLGCGVGAEAEFLARTGFTVDAIDKSDAMARAAKSRCANLPVNVIEGDFLDFEMKPDRYSLVTAINSLPFVAKKDCEELIRRVQDAMMPGGVAVLAVFGPEHQWKDRADMSFWSVDEFKTLWDGFLIKDLQEFKGMRPNMAGEDIYQHRIHLVAQKMK